MIFAIPFGKMADRFGRIETVVVSWIGEMGFMMLFAYSISPVMSLVSYCIWVAFGSMDAPALEAILGSTTRIETRGLSLGFFNTFATLVAIPSRVATGVLYSVAPKLPFFANLSVDLIAFLSFLYYLRIKETASNIGNLN